MSNTEIATVETDQQIARENAGFEMLQRQAKMFAASSLVPKEFGNNVANCALGISIAKRLGADPFMVLQNIDIIHGRPSFRATFLIAMVNAAGRFEPLQFKLEGTEGRPDRSCIAWTKSKADGATLEGPRITLEMAKQEGWSTKNGSKWLTMPELMLRYRAAAFFARLYAPDITLGMMTAEEAQDAVERDVTPPQAAASPLFKKDPAKDKSAEALTLDASAPTPRETFLAKVQALGVPWSQVGEVLFQNGVLNDPRAAAADCEDGEISFALSTWPQLEKMMKGGAK